jgi:hypothetical protein
MLLIQGSVNPRNILYTPVFNNYVHGECIPGKANPLELTTAGGATVYMNSLMAALNVRPLLAAGRSHISEEVDPIIFALRPPVRGGRLDVHMETATESHHDLDRPGDLALDKVLHVV